MLEHAKCIMSIAFYYTVPIVLVTGSTDSSARLWQLTFDEDDKLISICEHCIHADGPIQSAFFHGRLPILLNGGQIDGFDSVKLWF